MNLSRYPVFLLVFAVALLVVPLEASAKDEWVQVKSKNFYLIGNASEKEIRKVGTKLEQFRETFRQLFPSANLTAAIPTNVVVFKNGSSFKPFKPVRSDGKADTEIAGYFQPGEDVNYIALSTEGDSKELYGTIFHEYVHFIVDTNFGKSNVPQWFNEGLAEYYQTFEIADDIKVKLGLPQNNHLRLLQQSQLMPLDTLFNLTNRQVHKSGGHSRSIFYAQSWALVHYLTLGGKSSHLDTFLSAVTKGVKPETAFQEAFGTTYQKMENELRKYVSKNSYLYNEIKFKNKMEFDDTMRVLPLDESESNAYLGDLLYHSNRPDDAEPYLVNALNLQPDSSLANTTLGMVKLKQRKFDEARTLLEKAISGDPKNHVAYYRYATLLSREGQDEFGFVSKFDATTSAKMRDALRKSIALSPTFAESYDMLAYIALVNSEELEEAENYLRTALKYQPGNQRYSLRIAEILARKKKSDEAKLIAEKISSTADDSQLKDRADALLRQIEQMAAFEQQQETERKRFEAIVAASGGKTRPVLRVEGVNKPSDTEIARLQSEANIRAMNDAIRIPGDREQRVLGRIEKIDCKKRPIVYTVTTATEIFTVTSPNFDSLTLSSFDTSATDAELGCEAKIGSMNALVTFRPSTGVKTTAKGELVAVEFVPKDFRIMSEQEMNSGTLVIYDQPAITRRTPADQPPPPRPAQMPSAEDIEAKRREMILESVRNSIQKPGDGEKLEIGFLEKIECTNKAAYFHFRTATQVIKLLNSSERQPRIVMYTPDLGGVQFGCGIKPIEYPAVFIYSDKPDSKAKTAGEILSVEFVPKSFVLQHRTINLSIDY